MFDPLADVLPTGRRNPAAPATERGGREKAAIFCTAIGREAAAEVFRHLTEEEAMALTMQMTQLPRVTSAEIDEVLREFQELMLGMDLIQESGLEYARQVLEHAFGPEKAAEIMERITREQKKQPLAFLRAVDPTHLLNFIQSEHPQTIALILCYLTPAVASALLAGLPAALQADVARRVATMGRIDPGVLAELERTLERKFFNQPQDFARAGGIEVAVDMLNLADRATEQSIIQILETEDPELAEEIKQKMFIFDHIVLVDDHSLRIALQNMDRQQLARALKIADHDVREKVFGNLSRRQADMLREEMEFMGPVLRRDAEEAQQYIVAILRNMEEHGDLIIARPGHGDVVY